MVVYVQMALIPLPVNVQWDTVASNAKTTLMNALPILAKMEAHVKMVSVPTCATVLPAILAMIA